jgi:hypothetical protein
MAKQKSTKLRKLKSLESNLIYVQNVYKKMILKKAKVGKPVNILAERLKAVEIQLWMIRESVKSAGQEEEVSNGSSTN